MNIILVIFAGTCSLCVETVPIDMEAVLFCILTLNSYIFSFTLVLNIVTWAVLTLSTTVVYI